MNPGQLNIPSYHFTIDPRSSLLADMDIWGSAQPGVYEKGHLHEYYEILIFRKGGGTHQMGVGVYEVKDHSIHVLPGNTFHELKRTPEVDGFELIFSEPFLHQLQAFDRRTNYIHFFHESRVLDLTASEFDGFEHYFDDLRKHKEDIPLFYNLISIILLKLVTIGHGERNGVNGPDLATNLLALLNKHYKERPSLGFYANRLNMSVSTLQRHTKVAFGKSMMELQNEKVLHELKFLLIRNERSIKEIAWQFNFTDESHFTNFFRKHMGVAPSAFRKAAWLGSTMI